MHGSNYSSIISHSTKKVLNQLIQNRFRIPVDDFIHNSMINKLERTTLEILKGLSTDSLADIYRLLILPGAKSFKDLQTPKYQNPYFTHPKPTTLAAGPHSRMEALLPLYELLESPHLHMREKPEAPIPQESIIHQLHTSQFQLLYRAIILSIVYDYTLSNFDKINQHSFFKLNEYTRPEQLFVKLRGNLTKTMNEYYCNPAPLLPRPTTTSHNRAFFSIPILRLLFSDIQHLSYPQKDTYAITSNGPLFITALLSGLYALGESLKSLKNQLTRLYQALRQINPQALNKPVSILNVGYWQISWMFYAQLLSALVSRYALGVESYLSLSIVPLILSLSFGIRAIQHKPRLRKSQKALLFIQATSLIALPLIAGSFLIPGLQYLHTNIPQILYYVLLSFILLPAMLIDNADLANRGYETRNDNLFERCHSISSSLLYSFISALGAVFMIPVSLVTHIVTLPTLMVRIYLSQVTKQFPSNLYQDHVAHYKWAYSALTFLEFALSITAYTFIGIYIFPMAYTNTANYIASRLTESIALFPAISMGLSTGLSLINLILPTQSSKNPQGIELEPIEMQEGPKAQGC